MTYNSISLRGGIQNDARALIRPQGDDRTPPLPISSDFFSTFLDVSDSDPRSRTKD
jgi:hypothetical protein